MFSSGSKYLIGVSVLSLAAAVVYAFTVNPSDLGAIAMLGLMVAAGFIAGIGLHNNSGDVATVDEAVTAAANAPRDSAWPAVFALGVALTLLGLATVPVVFLLGLVAMLAGGTEWLIGNWADRASVDPVFNNERVRAKAIGPLEYPVAGALVLGVMAYLFSRVMLSVSKDAGAVLFIVAASAIVTVGFLAGFRPSFRGRALASVVTLGAIVLLGAGVTTGIIGEREQLAEASREDFYTVHHRECGEEKGEHYDHHANNKVNLRSAVLATVYVEDGKVFAREIGLDTKLNKITVQRSNDTNILFRNLDEKDHRMVIHLGEEKVAETGVVEKLENCTQLTGKNQENLLTVRIAKPSIATKDGYLITVPGAEGEIEVVVP
ncbi:MAG: hypothetical protein ACKOFF_04825 [Acidimicrobiales bacterium]